MARAETTGNIFIAEERKQDSSYVVSSPYCYMLYTKVYLDFGHITRYNKKFIFL